MQMVQICLIMELKVRYSVMACLTDGLNYELLPGISKPNK